MKIIYFLLCASSVCSLSQHNLEGDKLAEQKGDQSHMHAQQIESLKKKKKKKKHG